MVDTHNGIIHSLRKTNDSLKNMGGAKNMLSEIQKPERQVLRIFSHMWSRHLNLCVCAYGDQFTRMGTLGREDEVVRWKKWGRNEARCGIRAKDWTGLARRLQVEWDKAMRKRGEYIFIYYARKHHKDQLYCVLTLKINLKCLIKISERQQQGTWSKAPNYNPS